jgi:hypothetical protein
MLTKSQRIMADNGAPAKLFLTQKQRTAAWNANPDLGVVFTHSLKDQKEDKFREMRKQLKNEETVIRIQKMKGALARKAMKLTASDLRGKRWDARHNKFIPINKEFHMKRDDTETVKDDPATTSSTETSNVAQEKTMTATDTNEVTKRRKSPSKTVKKVVKKNVKANKTVKAKPNGSKVKKTPKGNGGTKRVAVKGEWGVVDNKVEKARSLMRRAKGATRAEILKGTGWKAINVNQIAGDLPGYKIVDADGKVDGNKRPFHYHCK